MENSKSHVSIPDEIIMNKIFLIRDKNVMLDTDLAELYAVETKHLKRSVRRNIQRFPEDFMFELSPEEFKILRSQFGTSSWGGSRYPPMAFKEHGVVMLDSDLAELCKTNPKKLKQQVRRNIDRFTGRLHFHRQMLDRSTHEVYLNGSLFCLASC